GLFRASRWDYAMYYGTIGLFGVLFFVFIRILPVISITEMRELVHETEQDQERRAEQSSTEGTVS
ncbi:MAG: hypothetical protein ACXVBO_03125, partial [Isosphaeraceae bacterium]